MILRIFGSREIASVKPGWEGFAASQKLKDKVSGYVSQPAHARLSASIAARLATELFGELSAEVVEAVGMHDAGWSMADLAALESGSTDRPASFLDVSSRKATDAWRHSIRAAEQRLPLQGVLTSRHFCLLAPNDGDPVHEMFVHEENRRRQEMQAKCGLNEADLDRYTAALGFCDLVSLLMCSGLEGKFELPLAHPAHPEARNANHVVCELGSGQVRFDHRVLVPETTLLLETWAQMAPGSLASKHCEWRSE
jgi:uncharacterized protein DUF3891